MRKIFRYALTGFVAASFSQIAFAQSVGEAPHQVTRASRRTSR